MPSKWKVLNVQYIDYRTGTVIEREMTEFELDLIKLGEQLGYYQVLASKFVKMEGKTGIKSLMKRR